MTTYREEEGERDVELVLRDVLEGEETSVENFLPASLSLVSRETQPDRFSFQPTPEQLRFLPE
jgi:hypothetical protein